MRSRMVRTGVFLAAAIAGISAAVAQSRTIEYKPIDSLSLYFRQNSTQLEPNYMGNEANLVDFIKKIQMA